MTKITFTLILTMTVLLGCQKETTIEKKDATSDKKEALLIGTFHYNNPGADVAKTKSFDILNEKSQLELDQISSKIKRYNPAKIFVEWPYQEQNELDSLYQLYRSGKYFSNDSLTDFYKKNEIFQLAFRIAKINNLDKVYAIDYTETEFPYQEVMNDIESNNQTALKEKIEQAIANFTRDFDSMINSGASLTALTLALNTKEMKFASNDLHNMFSAAGAPEEFTGVYLTSEWYKRNLYMWSLIQKHTSDSDKRIMVLTGMSHTAMLEWFIKENRDWKIKEVKDVIS
jgi:hypothetical protein